MRNRISLVGVGLLLWTLGLHFANTHIWRIEEAQDTHRALDWIQATRRAEHRVNLLVGSSNTACSFDPRQLDSLGTVDRWYNLGQPGMADFELVDFALRLVEQVGQDEVDALFIEIIAQDATQWVPDWRNVQIMEGSSALELLQMRFAIQEDDASGLSVKKGHKLPVSKGAGLTKKGVAAYRRKNPGSKLKTAVTTKPSKLDPDSKAAKRLDG